MCRAYRMDKRIDATPRLLPDFVAERNVAGDGVVIIQLIAPPMARAPADLGSGSDHFFDQRLIDPFLVALHVRDVRAERLHRHALLVAERIGVDDFKRMLLCGARWGKRNACRASRVLDDSGAWRQASV